MARVRGWPLRRLEDIADTALGKMLDAARPKGAISTPYLRNVNVRWGSIDVSDVKSVLLSQYERERFGLMPGDVLVCEGGEPGRAAVWTAGPSNMAFQKALHRVRCGGELDPRWLGLYLDHAARSNLLDPLMTGSTIKHLPQSALRGLAIPTPPIAAQRRIVDLVESHLSHLDAASTALVGAMSRADVLLYETVRRELCGRGPASEVSSPPSAGVDDGALPALGNGWRWLRLHELADVVGGVTKDAKKQDAMDLVEVPYLRVANVQRGRLDLSHVAKIRVPEATAVKLQLRRGDVLMNEGGDRDKLGRGWVWDGQIPRCIHQNHVFRARAREELIEPELLSLAANTIGGAWCERNGKQSVNLASISLSKIRLMPVPVPPRDQQSSILRRIRKVDQACQRLRHDVAGAAARSASLRRLVLAAAFEGRLTTSIAP